MTETDAEQAARNAQAAMGAEAFDPQDAILQKIDEMDSMENATFRVYRQNEGNSSKMDFLFTVPVDKYTVFDDLLSYIRDNYGGGDYRIHLRGPTDTGSNQLIINRLFSIAEPKKPEAEARSELSGVVESMMGELRLMRQEITESQRAQLNQPPPQAPDQMGMMKSMMELMTMMQGLMPQPAQGQQQTLAQQIEEYRKIKEIAGELGEGGDSDGFASLVKDGLKPMLELVQGEAEARKQAREQGKQFHPGVEGPKPNPRQPNPGQPNSTTKEGNDDMNAMDEGTKAMLANVKTLIVAASRNGDPEVYASMVLDFLPEDKYTQLYNFLIIPDSMDTVVHYVPEVAQHRVWFDSLRAGILEQLAPDGNDSDNAPHADAIESEDDGHRDHGGDSIGEGGSSGNASHDGEDRSSGQDSPSDS